MKIGIIGYGNMGEAIYRMLTDVFGVSNVYVADTHPEKLEGLPPDHVSADPRVISEQVDVLILAVKPQAFVAAAKALGDLKQKRVMSIMAGVSVASLQQHTGASEVVRTMPNLPLRVGKGLTAWYSSDVKDFTWVTDILDALGEHMRLEREELIDSVTAISGSGPAYFFFLCHLLFEKGVAYGFSLDQAQKLAEATLIGASALLESDTKSAGEWCKAVVSKGGTTGAALYHLQVSGWDRIFSEAVDCAKNRATELGKED